jgi:hypothetical protein
LVVGSPTWARTRDLRINSPSLYRLSYRGTGEAAYHTVDVWVGQRGKNIAVTGAYVQSRRGVAAEASVAPASRLAYDLRDGVGYVVDVPRIQSGDADATAVDREYRKLLAQLRDLLLG